MGSRDKSEATEGAVNLSGALGPQLTAHAAERCRHFFLYLFYYKVLTDIENRRRAALNPPKAPLGPNAGVSAKATHQVDEGFKSTDKTYWGFDNTDPNMVKLAATAFQATDAAHFCNLGVSHPTLDVFANLATQGGHYLDLFELLKIMCGNTRQLPKRVNIGPDRKIDIVHGRLALTMLDGTPPITVGNLATYVSEAKTAMTEYGTDQVKKGHLGVAACAQAYIDFYDSKKMLESVWQVVDGNVRAECLARGMTLADYLA